MSIEPVTGTVAAYLRVSSRIQRERETIASQREAVLGHVRERGWTLPEELVFADDGYSGATLERPALEALRDAVAGGEVDTAVAWSADRLSRKFAHQMLLQEEFARHGARIVFVQAPDDATPQGMLLRQMLSAISEYERTQIAERSRRGKIHRARQGSLNMLTRAPYGYRLIRKSETCGARVEIHEAEAAVVRRIFDLYVREGLKMHEIPQQLDAQGIRPRHARCWPISTVAVVLRNEAYVGRAAYLKTVGTGKPARQPHRTAESGARSALHGTYRTPPGRMDRIARSGHRRSGRLRTGAALPGGKSTLLRTQDDQPDPASGSWRVRRVRLHDGTAVRIGRCRRAPALLSLPRHRRLASGSRRRLRQSAGACRGARHGGLE